MSKQYGMIGLGKMGLPIAKNLLKAGYKLVAFDLNKESIDDVCAAGAQRAVSAADIAKRCDVIITMLPADKELLAVYLGGGGIAENCKQGVLCIDMTSARGETLRQIQKAAQEKGREILWLDAPVSGGVPAAETGALTIMVGGERLLFDEYKDCFEKIGRKIVYTGAAGSAKDMKMLNQALNAGNTCIAAEVMLLAKQLGVDIDIFMDIVNDSSGGSWIFKNNVPKFFLTHEHNPGFRLDLMKKDVSLVIDSAREKEYFIPVLQMVYQVFLSASNQGNGDKNYTYVAKWIEDNNL